MSRFDVYSNHDGQGFMLDVQADLLSLLNTRVVIPLLPQDAAPEPMDRLNPVFKLDGKRVVLMIQYLSAVPTKVLSNPVKNLEARQDEIVKALDFLQQGV